MVYYFRKLNPLCILFL